MRLTVIWCRWTGYWHSWRHLAQISTNNWVAWCSPKWLKSGAYTTVLEYSIPKTMSPLWLAPLVDRLVRQLCLLERSVHDARCNCMMVSKTLTNDWTVDFSPSLLGTPFKPVFKQLWSMNRCSWWSHTNDISVMVANRHVQYFHIEGLKIGKSFGFMLPSPRFYDVPSVGPYGLTVHLVCLDSLIFVVNYMFPHNVYYDNVLHVFGSYH